MKKFIYILLISFLIIPQFVFAYDNEETAYYMTFPEPGALNQVYSGSEHTYKEAFDSIIESTNGTYIFITANIRSSEWNQKFRQIYIFVTNTYPITSVYSYMHLYSSNTRFYYGEYANAISGKSKGFNTTAWGDSAVEEIKSCVSDYDSCSWNTSSASIPYNRPLNYANITNDSDFSFDISQSDSIYNLPIYRNFNLPVGTASQSVLDNTSYYSKKLYVNNIEIKEGMNLPTLYDLYYPPVPDEPVNPDEPVVPDEPTSDFTSWIYWFSEPTDSTSVLNNIYTLLFLYCISMIIFKIYSIVKSSHRRS